MVDFIPCDHDVCCKRPIHDIMRKPNSIIIVLLYIYTYNSSSETEAKQPLSKRLSNQADVELDMINAISAADIAFIMSSSQAIVN